LVVGDLTGGGSYCTSPTSPDYFGKFSYSWNSNGSTAATHLDDWLDPSGTNPSTLAGRGPCTTSAPVANFSANSTSIAVGGSVNFTDLSTNTPTSWSWTFSGGTPGTSTVQNPAGIVYNTAGTYTVTLVATNSYGSDTETKTSYITVTTGGAGTCDTLSLPLTGTAALYSASGGGYACGNNTYGDKAKAQYFATYSPYNKVNGVVFWFGAAEGGSGNAQAAVWNQSGSAPGTTFATANVSVSSIMSDVTNNYYTYVAFASPATIPGPFYAGVILPTTTGDTIGLVSNTAGEASPVNAWEMWSDNSWNNFSTAWNGNLDVQLAIFPHVCQVVTGTETYTLKPDLVQIFPNPATNKIYIGFGDQLLTQVDVKVLNILGEQVMETRYTEAASNMMEVDVTRLSPGTYFLHILSGDDSVVKSVTITR
jgi:PKD repeat protein